MKTIKSAPRRNPKPAPRKALPCEQVPVRQGGCRVSPYEAASYTK